MRITKMCSFLLVLVSAFGAMLILTGLLGMSPALAKGVEVTEPVILAPPAQRPPDDDWVIIVVFTDPVTSQVTDLSGNVIGEGTHEGAARCNRNHCNQKTSLLYRIPLTEPYSIEYKFTTQQALDPEAERAVVKGTGTLSRRGQKERFSFTATFQNNMDGTVWVRYEASKPDASFIIPKSPGTFTIFKRR